MKLGEDYLDAGKVFDTYFHAGFRLILGALLGSFVELHHGDPMESYSLHVKADQSLKKHR
jgi:hypothetical protein